MAVAVAGGQVGAENAMQPGPPLGWVAHDRVDRLAADACPPYADLLHSCIMRECDL